MAVCNTINSAQGARYSRASRSFEHFPDPFCDMASLAMPKTRQEALFWSEYIISANGPYAEAISRVISYFITDVQIDSVGKKRLAREEKQKYVDFLNDTIGIKEVLVNVAMDYLTYGNSFTSLRIPFRRYLSCSNDECNFTELPLKRVFNTPEFQFKWSNFDFHATCPCCGQRGKWRHNDRRSADFGEVKVKRWNPHHMEILHDSDSGDCAYIWKIPGPDRDIVRKGALFHLERTSWEMVEAVRNNEDLYFDQDVIYHMADDGLAGLDGRGWGFSRILRNFRQAWYVQVLQRYNEALCMDYIIPFRVLTPQPRPGQGGDINDPVLSMGFGSFVSRVQSMLAAHRLDPARWNVLPFPLQYQALGGEAAQVMPKELIEYAMSVLFDAIGIPVELYRGSLSVQAAPVAMRLFEARWAHLIYKLNKFLRELVAKLAQLMSWEPVVARLEPPRHADDLNRQMAILQLMMGGQISKTTALGRLNLEFVEEERRKVEEQRASSEIAAEAQKEMEQEALMAEVAAPQPQQGQPGQPPAQGGQPMPQQPGAMPAQGQSPGPPGAMGIPQGPYGVVYNFLSGRPLLPQQPTTLDEIGNIAQVIAQQVEMMPEGQKDSLLIQLKREQPAVHAMVQAIRSDISRDQKLRGGEMVAAQEYGKQAASRLIPPASASRLYRQLKNGHTNGHLS